MWALPKRTTKAQGEFARDRTLATEQVRHPHRRNAERIRKGGLRQSEFIQRLPQKFTGMDGRQAIRAAGDQVIHCLRSVPFLLCLSSIPGSVIVHDFNVLRMAVIEPEADAPLLVDANAPLSLARAQQRFEPVGRRQTQVVDHSGRVQLCQTHYRPAQDVWWQAPRLAGGEQSFRLGAGKAFNHVAIINNLFIFVGTANQKLGQSYV